MPGRASLTFLYTNIGRGHPFYLDGVLDALDRCSRAGLVCKQHDVFELSRNLPLAAWKASRMLYRHGSSGGLVGKFYSALRSGADYNRAGLLLHILGRSLRQTTLLNQGSLIVAHPILVAVFKGRKNLFYQHGEVITPPEAVVRGAQHIFVPTEEAAALFLKSGYSEEQMTITGLCVEPALVAQATDAFMARCRRISAGGRLTGAYFSSGAEPIGHLSKLVAAALSSVASGDRAVMFAKDAGRFQRAVLSALKTISVNFSEATINSSLPEKLPNLLVASYRTRAEENRLTARLFSSFDFLVAPAHERTNWALGLGLPMFVVGPAIGPFAPLNWERLLESGVARPIDSEAQANDFGPELQTCARDGRLEQMARAGWGKLSIDGFRTVAGFFVNNPPGMTYNYSREKRHL